VVTVRLLLASISARFDLSGLRSSAFQHLSLRMRKPWLTRRQSRRADKRRPKGGSVLKC
jgi:hypothetical protein